MSLRFAYRRYRLPFRVSVNTAHGSWREREGVIVRLEDEAGRVGWGEAAPIPWFGLETVDQVLDACASVGTKVEAEQLDRVSEHLATFLHALRAARSELMGEVLSLPAIEPTAAVTPVDYLGVAALLPAGRAVLAALPPKAEAGFRVFKWKVGVGDLGDELALLDDVCAALPDGAKLRLDANGAWDRRQAERWLERCADRPIEYVEQPCFAGPGETETVRRRTDDWLRGLAGDFPTRLALDESLVSEGDVERWLAVGWPGIFVVKPLLFADPRATLATLAKARAEVVFSSALETGVGARSALQLAFAWTGGRRALGFGVWPLFAEARCDGPAAAPFVRREDVAALNPEAVWNTLN